MKKTIYDKQGCAMTINFPSRIQITPDSEPVSLPMTKCEFCGMPMVPSHPTHGGRMYQVNCVNPDCINNPDSKAYEDYIANKSQKRSLNGSKLTIRDGVWHLG